MGNLYFSEADGRFEVHDGEYDDPIEKVADLERHLKESETEVVQSKKALRVLRDYSPKNLRDIYERKRKLDRLVNEQHGLWLFETGRKPEYAQSEWVQGLVKKGMKQIESEIETAKKAITPKDKRLFARIEKIFE